MPDQCRCRLLVVGAEMDLPPEQTLRDWIHQAEGFYLEPLEYDSERLSYQFETTEAPVLWLGIISREHPSLTFLLDYEVEECRKKGLAKGVRGQVEHCEIAY